MMNFGRAKTDVVEKRKMVVSVPATERQLRHALFDVGDQFKRNANKEILHGQKTGRVYVRRIRGGRTRKHRASAPGETHANLTGELRRSIGWKVSGSRRLLFGYGITQDAPKYARAIEQGSKTVKKRPSLKNAIEAERRNTMNSIERAAKKAFNP